MKTKQITLTVPSFEGYKTLIANTMLAVGGVAGASDAIPGFSAWLSAHPGPALIFVAAVNILLRIVTAGPVGGTAEPLETDADWGAEITPHTIQDRAEQMLKHRAAQYERERTPQSYDSPLNPAVISTFVTVFVVSFSATLGALTLLA
jgi:hypothetical protein